MTYPAADADALRAVENRLTTVRSGLADLARDVEDLQSKG